MSTLLIKNGFIVDPLQDKPFKSDLLIHDGKIKEIHPNISQCDADLYDATGKYVCPGFIDLEAHILRSLQDVEKTLETSTREAVKGGFTTLCAMPDTTPPLDNEGMIGLLRLLSEKRGWTHVIPAACATKGMKGEQMAEIGMLIAAGAGLIYDADKTIADTLLLRQLLEYAKMFNVPFFLHPEDERLSKDGLMHEGEMSTRMGLMGIPSISENTIVSRDLLLAEYLNVAIHIPHVTTAVSLRLIREAKKRGVKVTCHATPHHLDLTDKCITTFNTSFKIKPPLRSEEDRIALIEAIKDGTLDAVATDHIPCSEHSKDVEFADAPFGVIGLETAFQVLYDRLVIKEKLPLNTVVRLLTQGPANILKIDKGSLQKGSDADLTLIDLNTKKTITKQSLISRQKNSPFIGREFSSVVDACIINGCFRFKLGTFLT